MPKDYKHRQVDHASENGNQNLLLTFLLGLAIGLVIAGVALYQSKRITPVTVDPASEDIVTLEPEEEKVNLAELAEQEQLQEPTYEFYKILPDLEVDVTQWNETETVIPDSIEDEEQPGVYVIQVGSFRKLEAADQVKARLALLGINADIQRVVINGQDVYHRVRVGPYNTAKKLQDTQSRLIANELNFKLLKLTIEEQ